ncbi:hypothetical protein AB0F88_21700 [Streptosporangium sp. NPDC023963]|uniref:hypothetical protein n=1 Tax=Streptosporangium sp. NPDC023963 TaxID=3155608 RepID=UPI003447A347
MTRPPLHIDELVEHWTILDEEHELIAGKRGATRLAFGILLKFCTRHGPATRATTAAAPTTKPLVLTCACSATRPPPELPPPRPVAVA